MASISFSLSNGTVSISSDVRSGKVYTLPDKTMLFHAKLASGLDLLVLCKQRVQIGRETYRYTFSIYDKKFDINCSGSFRLVFTSRNCHLDSYTYDVDVENGGTRWTHGWLSLWRDGRVAFKNEPISSSDIRRIFERARILYGSD